MSKKTEKKEGCKVCAAVHAGANSIWQKAKANKKAVVIVGAVVVALWAVCGMECSSGKVGVVDINVIRTQAVVYKQIAEEQKKYEVTWQIKLNAEKELLTQEDKALAARKNKDAAFKKDVEVFQKKVIEFQKKYQAEYSQILLATQQAVRDADQMAGELARDLGKQKCVSILISKQAVLYSADNVDLTTDFVALLDKEAVKVTYPEPAKMQLPQN